LSRKKKKLVKLPAQNTITTLQKPIRFTWKHLPSYGSGTVIYLLKKGGFFTYHQV